jgi:peptide-methionine (S)-S-oxide reductase
VLGGGCFWCTESVYKAVRGVLDVESGYSNGFVPRPTYEEVCTGLTGCNEVVKLVYDPAVISTREILEIFFVIHDPTTLNRQGNDVGTQYRSAIFYSSPEQKATAEDVIAKLTEGKLWKNPIVTEVAPAAAFHMAEPYHQEYYQRVGGANPYCSMVVEPKVAKFRKAYFDRLKR